MIEASIEDRDDGAMTSSLLKAQFDNENGGAAAFARAFPCGRRGI
jgi:hypothetical protein